MSYILLQNPLHSSSKLLSNTTKLLLDKLQIQVNKTQEIALEDRFLPFINAVHFYKPLLKALLLAHKEESKLLVCETQSLLAIRKFFAKLCAEVEFKEALSKECEVEIDVLSLENCYVFLLEVALNATPTKEGIKLKRWNGFKCAFIIDRILEQEFHEQQLISKIESITGLKIYPIFKESYAYLLQTNSELAYKMGSLDYYAMVDLGVDFILTLNLGNFDLMDTHTKSLQNTAGRDLAEIPLLLLTQVFLALFSDSNAQSLRFNAHKIKPQML